MLARAPHPRELLAAMPDKLISAIGTGRRTCQQFRRVWMNTRDAGAGEICLVPATPAGDELGQQTLEIMKSQLGQSH